MNDSAPKVRAGRIVPAPIPTDRRLQPTILDVVCGLDEKIEWHWRMTDRGPVVSGYSITRLPADPTVPRRLAADLKGSRQRSNRQSQRTSRTLRRGRESR